MDFIRRLKNTSHNTIVIILIIGIVVILNFISLNHFLRLDLTEENRYTLSDTTKNAMRELDDVVTVKAFFSKKLPPDLVNLTREINDVLDEFSAYSNNNLQVRFLDPADDPKIADEAMSLGVPELDMNIIEKDKVQLQKGYLGIAISYGDKTEVLPVVQSTSNLEYDLVSAVKKVIASRVKIVGFLTGHGEHEIMEMGMSGEKTADYTIFKKALDKNYETTTITAGQEIKDVDTLVIAGPKEPLSDRDVYEIDQFIINGGNVIFLIDAVSVLPGLQASSLDVNLDSFLSNLGIKISRSLVVDTIHETAAFSSGFVQFFIPYPLWPKLVSENFQIENPILAKIDSFVMPWSSPLEQTSGSGLNVEILASSSDEAWSQTAFDLNPEQSFMPQGETKSYPMVASISGKLKSYFADKEIPPKESAEEPSDMEITPEEEKSASENRETIKESVYETRIVVVGDSDFVSDGFVSRFPNNLNFILNTVDYLTLDSDLIGIRAKKMTSRPLTEVSEAQKSLIKIVGIWLVPVIVGVYGIFRNIRRRRIRRMILL